LFSNQSICDPSAVFTYCYNIILSIYYIKYNGEFDGQSLIWMVWKNKTYYWHRNTGNIKSKPSGWLIKNICGKLVYGIKTNFVKVKNIIKAKKKTVWQGYYIIIQPMKYFLKR